MLHNDLEKDIKLTLQSYSTKTILLDYINWVGGWGEFSISY